MPENDEPQSTRRGDVTPIPVERVDELAEPVYRQFEGGAITSADVFPAIQRLRGRPPLPPASQTRHAAFGVVEGLAHGAERAVARTRDAAARLLGVHPSPPRLFEEHPLAHGVRQAAPFSESQARGAAPGTTLPPAVASPFVRTHALRGTAPARRGRDARRGRVISIRLVLENHSRRPYYSLRFRSTDLLSSRSDRRIHAKQVSFEPEMLNLAAQTREYVTMRVDVPSDAKPDSYIARVDAVGVHGITTIVTVDVT